MHRRILAIMTKLVRRPPGSPPSHRPTLEPLEDRCLPSANMMMATGLPTPPTNVQPPGVTAIASLPHDQIHVLLSQSQQQAAIATIVLDVEQATLALVQQIAPQAPQFQ